jgi:Flp pilus assembly protein TadG
VRSASERAKERRGAAAAELAILLPFIALLFGVTLDFCRIFHASQTIQNCAYAGALYASESAEARPEFSDAEEAARDAAVAEGASLSPPLKGANVATTYDGTGNTTVTVRYDFALITPFMGIGRKITIMRSVTMNVVP